MPCYKESGSPAARQHGFAACRPCCLISLCDHYNPSKVTVMSQYHENFVKKSPSGVFCLFCSVFGKKACHTGVRYGRSIVGGILWYFRFVNLSYTKEISRKHYPPDHFPVMQPALVEAHAPCVQEVLSDSERAQEYDETCSAYAGGAYTKQHMLRKRRSMRVQTGTFSGKELVCIP